jgi:phospholipid/cholesterol/gamma-HCH transport system permease protein
MRRLLEMLRIGARGKSGSPGSSEPFQAASGGDSGDDTAQAFNLKVEHETFDALWVNLSGQIFMDNADIVREQLIEVIKAQPLKNLVLDMSSITYFDSSGAAILTDVQRMCGEMNNTLRLANVPERMQSLVKLVDREHLKDSEILMPRQEPSLLVQIGDGTRKVIANAKDIIAFIGAVAQATAHDLVRPRRMKWDRLWKLIERSGSDAVPIVTALSFLMGGILAFQAALQLRKFGANIFVADLVSVSICVEMGPLLVALIVTGRSGAAFAAQIGTMQVNEEVDALRVMGIDPIRYLVAPRIVAVAFALPCLTLFADLIGVLGGCLVASFSLDLTPTTFFNQVRKVLEVSDVLKGVLKSAAYGVEIALIGCLRGFQVRGGAASVGHATTSTVVTCIFVLTVTNAVFSLLYHYLPRVWSP